MSIIRDFIEYYRMPAEVKTHLTDFDVEHTLLNGYEEKYYYALDGSNHYIMIIDMFTQDSVRYRRMQITYDINFNILYINNQYEYGTKMRVDTFEYGSGVTAGAVIRVDTAESSVNITWDTLSASTGWPSYSSGGGIVSIVAGNNIIVNNTDPKNPIVSSTATSLLPWRLVSSNTQADVGDRIFVDTSLSTDTVSAPGSPLPDQEFTVCDYSGTFDINICTINGMGANIMGTNASMVLNVANITVKFVYFDSIKGWKIVSIPS